MNRKIANRIRKEAYYITKNNATMRQTAKKFNVSESTVHRDVTKLLRTENIDLYYMVKEIIQFNKQQRAIRGGMATKKKYKK